MKTREVSIIMDDKIKNFKDLELDEAILKAINMLGFNQPTEVQRRVIPIILRNKDIIVKSQTGSGKTAAFGIPICDKILTSENEPQALILTPTRELCVQIKDDITNIGRYKRIRCAAVFGKQPISIQTKELKQRVHVVSGTPGRVIDHIKRGNLLLQKIRYLIIDEADEMLNMGFIDQVKEIIQYLPVDRITMLFSATMSQEIESLCNNYLRNPVKIEIEAENITVKNIEEIYFEINNRDKFNLLKKIINVELPESCIIFCRTKENVNNLNTHMQKSGLSCNAIHGGLMQKDRLSIMKSFKRGEFNFLIATDVAARGIDISKLSHIINYDIPLEKESYVHRIGRTARAGNSGKALTFVCPEEYKYLNQIENYIGYNIPKGEIPSDEVLNKNVKLKSVLKEDKAIKLNNEITKIYLNVGKKKKIRPGDIVGGILSISGISAENIGIIDVRDNFTYVDILDGKGELVINALKDITIKGKKVKAEEANIDI